MHFFIWCLANPSFMMEFNFILFEKGCVGHRDVGQLQGLLIKNKSAPYKDENFAIYSYIVYVFRYQASCFVNSGTHI